MQSAAHPRIDAIRSRLVERDARDRVITGAAAGLARRIGVEPALLRIAFAVLALAGGAGIVAYLVLAASSVEPGPAPKPHRAAHPGPRQVLAITSFTTGTLLLLREGGWWFGDRLVWPVAVAVVGAGLIWVNDAGRGTRPADVAGGDGALKVGKAAAARIVGGAVLVLAGMVAFARGNFGQYPSSSVIVPVTITVFGITLIFGPWLWRLAVDLAEERRERIRSDERADMAAHLHDSVLQSLALIQRARDAREMATLARAQERELRAWLYTKRTPSDEDSIAGAIESLAAAVESTYRVRVEAIVVGDGPLDDRAQAIVAATGEAITNAARHSGADSIAVFVEVRGDGVSAYVRDLGRGFKVDEISPDRVGIARSIRGRIERAGGSASIVASPGDGTEVRLQLPLHGGRR
ncbi:MAG TPA: PspC domain-containing protein [Actinomycetota bacterium]|nr:PspC domain-containing protein [Actinomycetota bacterium]